MMLLHIKKFGGEKMTTGIYVKLDHGICWTGAEELMDDQNVRDAVRKYMELLSGGHPRNQSATYSHIGGRCHVIGELPDPYRGY